jgi:hypothetical protein
MKTITPETSKPHLQRSRWRESSERLFRFFSRSWLILFVLVALASTARGRRGTNTARVWDKLHRWRHGL